MLSVRPLGSEVGGGAGGYVRHRCARTGAEGRAGDGVAKRVAWRWGRVGNCECRPICRVESMAIIKFGMVMCRIPGKICIPSQ